MSGRDVFIDISEVKADAIFAKKRIDEMVSIWDYVCHHKEKYMDVRDAIKDVFDFIENDTNQKYIGILEWAFAQSMIDECCKGECELNIEYVLEKFWSNRDIKAILRADGQT